ncbi:DUF2591 family protein [Enterobacter soli]|nr:DUF2591 family protein [Enterobacter soli]
MDYSQLSDFEINATIHFGKRPEFKIQNGYVSFLNDEGEKTGFGRFYYKNNFPDYCNNPADAWPIIVESKIMLSPHCADDEWKAQIHLGRVGIFDNYASAWNKNPLRAAMIVFLMIQEAKHA